MEAKSLNYASNYSKSASSIIHPNGNCLAHQNYGEAGIVVAVIDPEQATGLLAKRFKNHLYY